MHITEWEKKPVCKDSILYVPTVWHSGKGKTKKTVQISVVFRGWRWKGLRDEYSEHRGFLEKWKYYTWYSNNRCVSLHVCPIHRMYTSKSESECKLSLWVIMLHQSVWVYQLRQVLPSGGGCWWWRRLREGGSRRYMGNLHTFQFCYEPKSALKIKSLKNL